MEKPHPESEKVMIGTIENKFKETQRDLEHRIRWGELVGVPQEPDGKAYYCYFHKNTINGEVIVLREEDERSRQEHYACRQCYDKYRPPLC